MNYNIQKLLHSHISQNRNKHNQTVTEHNKKKQYTTTQNITNNNSKKNQNKNEK